MSRQYRDIKKYEEEIIGMYNEGKHLVVNSVISETTISKGYCTRGKTIISYAKQRRTTSTRQKCSLFVFFLCICDLIFQKIISENISQNLHKHIIRSSY